jgi:peptidoglycan/LPS O-acetylase OafA/YrhL
VSLEGLSVLKRKGCIAFLDFKEAHLLVTSDVTAIHSADRSSSEIFMKQTIAALHGLRGIAALVVFLHHFLIGFAPKYHGMFSAPDDFGNLRHTYFYAAIHGTAAVTLFFVLSGFVLAFSVDRHLSKLRIAIVKRLPRLMLLPLISIMGAYLLYSLGWLHYRDAAAITNSEWMMKFGSSPNQGIIRETFISALLQGWQIFVRSGSSLNTSLWTIHYEFIGSFIVFGYVFATAQVSRRNFWLVTIPTLLYFHDAQMYHYNAFLVGAVLNWHYCNSAWPSGKPYLHAIAIGIGWLLFGFSELSFGLYSIFETIDAEYLQLYLHIIASALTIWALISSKQIGEFCSTRVMKFIGDISFPLYVIHVPLLFSLPAYAYSHWFRSIDPILALLLTFSLELALCVPLSWLLFKLDRAYCKAIANFVDRQFTLSDGW